MAHQFCPTPLLSHHLKLNNKNQNTDTIKAQETYHIPISEAHNMDMYNNTMWEQESSASPQAASHSDEEVILAASCPKKRAGRKKFKETRHPVYRGIRRRNNNRWVCELRALNNKTRIWLGTYPTAEMAARAHDVAALALRGRMACLNFADSATILPVPASGDIKDIQRAAAEAAEGFRPPEPEQENMTVEEESVGMVEEVSLSEGRRRKEYQESLQESNNAGSYYMDDEATYQMPNLLTHMAEGMLMSPPHHNMYESFGWDHDQVESECEVSLWSYSI